MTTSVSATLRQVAHVAPRASVCVFAAAAAAMIINSVAVPAAFAQSKREIEAQEEVAPRVTSPVTVLVSLNKQRLWVYDANGLVTSSRVSTGMAGYDTPKGVYSIIEKKVEHTSNIYEGASMPYMQRLLQTGIAMHAGVVPGYPASHGCIRLPFAFAPKLFDMTTMNERVVVQPEVMAPVAIEHDALFTALPPGSQSEPVGYVQKTNATQDDLNSALGQGSSVTEPSRTRATVAAERAAERSRLAQAIETAAGEVPKAEAAIPAAMKAAETARIELKKVKAEAWRLSKAADKAVDAKERATAKRDMLARQIERKKARMLSSELDAMRQSQDEVEKSLTALAAAADQASAEAKTAAAAADAAQKAVADADKARVDAKKTLVAARNAVADAEKALAKFDRQDAKRSEVVSVLVSGKTGKISIRQGWEMVAEAPITIKNPELELGTYLFTAMGWKDDTQTALKWSVAAAGPDEGSEAHLQSASLEQPSSKLSRKEREREKERLASLPPPSTDANKAAAVLSRIEVPDEMRMKIAEVMKPGSTLIISDFDMARSETRPGTDFVVQTPEVIAKITAPPPKRKPDFVDDYYEGGWFFFSSPKKYKDDKARRSFWKPTPTTRRNPTARRSITAISPSKCSSNLSRPRFEYRGLFCFGPRLLWLLFARRLDAATSFGISEPIDCNFSRPWAPRAAPIPRDPTGRTEMLFSTRRVAVSLAVLLSLAAAPHTFAQSIDVFGIGEEQVKPKKKKPAAPPPQTAPTEAAAPQGFRGRNSCPFCPAGQGLDAGHAAAARACQLQNGRHLRGVDGGVPQGSTRRRHQSACGRCRSRRSDARSIDHFTR